MVPVVAEVSIATVATAAEVSCEKECDSSVYTHNICCKRYQQCNGGAACSYNCIVFGPDRISSTSRMIHGCASTST